MADETFETNLLRLVAAETFFLLSLNASREMFGKGYFSLGVSEKAAVDQAVLAAVGANYQSLTPEYLKSQTIPQTVGFQPSKAEEKKS